MSSQSPVPVSSAASVVTEFVLDRLHTLPLAERIRISRATAALISEGNEQRALLQIVAGLERIERQQRKLTLQFKRRRTGGQS